MQKGYPKWAPVTVLSQHCESLQFISHFSAWPNLNFDLAPPAWRPLVKYLHLLELATPTLKNSPSDAKVSNHSRERVIMFRTCRRVLRIVLGEHTYTHSLSHTQQIYRMEGGDRRPLPPVPSSHLSAGGVYMFQWTLRHASPLYMWVETAVCVWIGSAVADYWEAVAGCVRHVDRETVRTLSSATVRVPGHHLLPSSSLSPLLPVPPSPYFLLLLHSLLHPLLFPLSLRPPFLPSPKPLTLVPSGEEPPHLLSFFQGHLVVHNSPHSSPHPSPLLSPHRVTPSPHHKAPRLYQVSGSSLEHIKAVEVHIAHLH